MEIETLLKSDSELFDRGCDCFLELGQRLVQRVKEHAGYLQKLMDANPRITKRAVRFLVAIGEGRCAPGLLGAGELSHGRLALSKCGLETQRTYLSEPVPVLVPGGDVLLVGIDDLNPMMVRQVFSRSGELRSPAEQKIFQVSTRVKPPVSRHRIRGNFAYFDAGGRFTRCELEKIAAELPRQ